MTQTTQNQAFDRAKPDSGAVLGEVLKRKMLITDDQLKRARDEQSVRIRELDQSVHLGLILVEQQYVTEEELLNALEEVKKAEVSTLVDIKVLPKTMTEGYEAWWRVGNAEVAKNEKIVKITEGHNIKIKEARPY